jgi:hypothetical protein
VISPSYSYRQDMVRSVFGVVKLCPPPPSRIAGISYESPGSSHL